jgi:hypothetical protein
MKVGIFYNSISNPIKFPNKVMLMDNFKQGVLTVGDEYVEYRGTELPAEKLDAGFVLGYTLQDNFRRKIINTLIDQQAPQVFVDSNILHYSRKEHEWHRYSLNSVYPNNGVYFFNELDTAKWNEYSTWHNATVKPWRTTGKHILIFCQRPNGWNMLGQDQGAWVDQTIHEIRKYSQRPIMIRMHPGDGKKAVQIEKLKARYGNTINISTHESITEALVDCWCVVGYNSTPSVVSAIEGIPAFLSDPNRSWAKDIAATDLSLIETPLMPDRTEWLHKIANIHWSNDEVRAGKLWAAIKNYISSAQ